ncbi:MAG: hypothetical protein DRN26_04585, partial [Thermoplasmata archaeon]
MASKANLIKTFVKHGIPEEVAKKIISAGYSFTKLSSMKKDLDTLIRILTEEIKLSGTEIEDVLRGLGVKVEISFRKKPS